MRRPALLLIALLALLPLAACGDDGGGGGDDEATETTGLAEDPLEGRTFESVTIEGETDRTLVDGSPIRLGFADGEVTLDTGCNQYSGPYEIDGPFLETEIDLDTTNDCDPDQADQEAWIVSVATERPAFSYAPPDSIVLTQDKVLLTLVEQTDPEGEEPAEFAGPLWTADSIIDGEEVGSLPSGATVTITFAADGTYQVAAGCNTGNGTYAEAGPGTVTIDPPTLTRERCADEVMEAEAAVVATLDGDVTFRLEPDRLTLTAADGAGLSFTSG